uniref:Zinc finger, C2H2 type family protein n=1 Tax=Brugia malayi TaxID=6279 RepID=A8PJF0_BRUMA
MYICRKEVATMKKHITTHIRKKPHSCPVCRKSCSRKQDMRTYMINHDINRPVYPCTVCNKDFWSKDKLKSHMWNH